ncbi:RDD family protein [Candidatus Woesearchaeota archaeon]|nr:RDD family protein [Candidatus Woesearchaeota archaeon]
MTDYLKLLNPRTAKVHRDATFLRRAGAFILDLLLIDLIITAPYTPLFMTAVSRMESQGFFSMTYTSAEVAAMAILFLTVYVYFVVFEFLLDQTPGMIILSTKVQSDGKLWRILLRNMFLFPVFPIIVLWIVEPVSILLTRRSMLEQATHTRTLHKREVLF